MRGPIRIATLAAAALLATTATPAAAQVMPFPDNDLRGEQRAYRAELLRHAYGTLTEWNDALLRGDVDAAADLYTRNAGVLLPEATGLVQGQGAIEEALETALPTLTGLRVALTDASATDWQVFILGNFVYEADGAQRTGTHVTVLEGRGERWRIRSQVFRLDPAPAQTAGAPDAVSVGG